LFNIKKWRPKFAEDFKSRISEWTEFQQNEDGTY